MVRSSGPEDAFSDLIARQLERDRDFQLFVTSDDAAALGSADHTPLHFGALELRGDPVLPGIVLETPPGVDKALDWLTVNHETAWPVNLPPRGDGDSQAAAVFKGFRGKSLWWLHVLDFGNPSMPFYGLIRRRWSDEGVALHAAISLSQDHTTESLPDEEQLATAQAAFNALAESPTPQRVTAQRAWSGGTLLKRLLGWE